MDLELLINNGHSVNSEISQNQNKLNQFIVKWH